MKIRTILFLALTCFVLLPSARAQNVEVTGYIGGQLNGGVDLSTTIFRRIDVQNSLNFGASAGYLFGDHFGAEFQWNKTRSDTLAEPRSGGPGVKVFTLDQNQYMGNFLLHFRSQEYSFRPFAFVGFGANALSTNVARVSGSTRFAFSIGGGAKYNLSRHFGLRGQVKYTPTYLTTTTNGGGYWCDPIWGGCWVVGKSHYLNEVDFTGGITLRF